MRKQDVEDAVNLLIRLKESDGNGFVSDGMLETTDQMIQLLDAEIAAMDEVQKSEGDWNIIGLAYHFYRLRSKWS